MQDRNQDQVTMRSSCFEKTSDWRGKEEVTQMTNVDTGGISTDLTT